MTLLRITDALRTRSDPDDIMFSVCRILGEHFRASRAFYATIVDESVAIIGHDYVDGVASMAGRLPLDVYGEKIKDIFRRGADLIVEDARIDPRIPDAARAGMSNDAIVAGIATGLIKSNRWVGTLSVHSATPRTWTHDDVSLLRETADRTWAALERAQAEAARRESEERYTVLFEQSEETARLYEQSRERLLHLDAMERLHRVSTRFLGEDGLQGVLDEIVEAAIAVTEADFGNIKVLDQSSGDLEIVASRGFPDWWLTYWRLVSADRGCCGSALESRKRVIVEDVARSAIFDSADDREMQLRAGVRACQSTPLVDRSGVVLGVISTHYTRPQRPSDRALRLLDMLARQAADILDRAARETEERRREMEQRLLADVSGALSTADYDRAFATVTRVVATALSDLAVLYVIQEDGAIRRVAAASRVAEQQSLLDAMVASWSQPRPTHPVLKVIASRRSLVQSFDPGQHDSLAESPVHLAVLQSVDPRYALLAPMISGESCVGCVALTSTSRPFEKRDTALLEEIGRRCALFVENSRLHERERRAIRTRSDVLGMVAHDLRNPLHSIVVNARLLQQLPGDLESLDSIQRASARMSRILEDLLNVARFEAGRLDVERAPVPPGELVADAARTYRKLVVARGLEFRVSLAPGLAPVLADRERVAQVLENLLSNAMKFTTSGTITIGVRADGRVVEFFVADTGEGIAPEHLPMVFDAFWQARRQDRDGAGLGLSIVKSIVETHGGRVWATSDVGVGSTFHFTLPVAPGANMATTATTAAEAPAPQVLIVDDDDDLRRTLDRLLRLHGYATVTAKNGQEALDYLGRGERPSVILLDLAMPVMDGWSVLEARRQRPDLQSIPVIVMSGQDSVSTRVATMSATLLQKPVPSDLLLSTMPVAGVRATN
ncbi:MAG TPA: GAF domain-containing protein [Gemmatimonadaceae bacterium]